MEQKLYTIEDYRALLDTPVEPFKEDLRKLCRTAFGSEWMDKHPGQEAIDKLRSYDFLPPIFIAMYEVISGEERLHQLGLLSADKAAMAGKMFIYWRHKKESFSFKQEYEGEVPAPAAKFPPRVGILVGKKSPYFDDIEWTHWSNIYGESLASLLLRQVGEALSAVMPNCVWVQGSVKKEGRLSRYETIAKRFDCSVLECVAPHGWEFTCDLERQLLLRYFDYDRKKVLIYSQDQAQLEKLGECWPIVWQRRDGKKILDPAKFIHSQAPITFEEKLEAMSRALLGKRSMALAPEEINKAEARLDIKFPEALRQFYLRFGKGGKLFTSDSLHDILTFKQMTPEDDDFGEEFREAREQGSLLLAVENQGVWRIYLNCRSGELWMDWGKGPQDCWGLDMEGTLLYLLSMNALGFLPRGGDCDMEDTPENRELLGHYFHFLTEGKMAVFADPDKGLVGCRYISEQIYIKAHSEKPLNQLEEYADIFVGEF